jgi:hypothetical protein
MHDDTRSQLEMYLSMLSHVGEDAMFNSIKKAVAEDKVRRREQKRELNRLLKKERTNVK